MRATLEKKLAQKEKEKKERKLVELAQRARDERAGIKAAAGTLIPGNMCKSHFPTFDAFFFLTSLDLQREQRMSERETSFAMKDTRKENEIDVFPRQHRTKGEWAVRVSHTCMSS